MPVPKILHAYQFIKFSQIFQDFFKLLFILHSFKTKINIIDIMSNLFCYLFTQAMKIKQFFVIKSLNIKINTIIVKPTLSLEWLLLPLFHEHMNKCVTWYYLVLLAPWHTNYYISAEGKKYLTKIARSGLIHRAIFSRPILYICVSL